MSIKALIEKLQGLQAIHGDDIQVLGSHADIEGAQFIPATGVCGEYINIGE